jgi:glutaredoxin
MATLELRIYSRPGCHLCEDMKRVASAIGEEFDCTIEEIDISSDDALESRFGTEIPVLFINGRKAFKYTVSPSELRRRLRREGRTRRSWW